MIFGSFLDVINFTEIVVKINVTEISVVSTEINNLVYHNHWLRNGSSNYLEYRGLDLTGTLHAK